ncbi:MAG: YARHG domain-containing protein [Robinsoniella sp.]|nr:YARHG domain-containing protein [Robinsoniella sp.]
MRKKQFAAIVLAAGMLLSAGCGGKTEGTESGQKEPEMQEAEEGAEEENGGTKENQEESEGIEEEENLGQLDDDNLFASGNTFSWQEITISIPDSWEGKYQVEQVEDGFALIQTASQEKLEGMGFICGFYRADGMMPDMAGATQLAYTDTQTYYMSEPTDVSFYYEDEKISQEYIDMAGLTGAVAATLEIDKEGVKYNPDEFILPLSSTVLAKDEDLFNYSDNELTIARNEIYARHGRQFDSAYLQSYFETCSWYEGTIPAKEFDESVLSQIEKDNLQMIKKAEEEYKAEHPYPKEYSIGSKVKEDLDGDKVAEEIQYSLKEGGQEKFSGMFNINGQEYKLEDYDVHLEDPVKDVFYVTNIIESWSEEEAEKLELAVLDNGAGNGAVTHFFAYNGELFYIGNIQGFPFKQKSGYNGFVNYGDVTGEIHLNLPHTCYGYGSWWYNEDEQKLAGTETGYFRLVPEGSHQLYEDLTVHMYADENSTKKIVPAQEKVFFMEVWTEDGKDGWVLVKGKDGSKGYIHIVDGKIEGLSKTPAEVFSDLNVSNQ